MNQTPVTRPPVETAIDTPVPSRRDWRGLAMICLAVAGLVVSGYLSWVHFSGSPALCTGVGGCAQVQASRYAVVAGVPLPYFGFALYITIAVVAVWRAVHGFATATAVLLLLFGLTLAGALYSVYLTYLQLFVIGAVCPWCAASAIILWTLAGQATLDLFAEPAAAQ